ncbi:metal-binding protein [Halobacteriales archaeon QS_1_67_19]|nr:MAG: metal-binding protein [Halobacteriales archaeon QS_1_67_19]
MECRQCASPLDRPGDYCLVCRTPNADAVMLELERERATLTMLDEQTTVGETVVTTTPEDGEETGVVELRNFAGRIADEVRRKRPEEVYAAGDRDVLRTTRDQLRYSFYRVADDDPVEAVLARRGDRALEVVEAAPAEKIGGSHSTLIGNRAGRKAVRTVAGHPHVKKIIPGPIDAGGSGSRTGVRAKATRADENGNVRMLIRDGSSVQENRVVTTAMDRESGERVRSDLNDALADADLR